MAKSMKLSMGKSVTKTPKSETPDLVNKITRTDNRTATKAYTPINGKFHSSKF